jgi:hypothetical protein
LKADQKDLPNLPLTPSTNAKGYTLSQPFPVGDCFMLTGSFVQFYRNGTFFFQGTTTTTDGNDYWHQTFAFRDAYGRYLSINPPSPFAFPFVTQEINGPTMTQPNKPFTFQGQGTYPNQFFNIMTAIDWMGEC